MVSGNVTTSDREGNFFRSFFIEDETGAVEIRAGLYDLHAVYRLGQQVTVVADSLTLGLTGGVLQLGLPVRLTRPITWGIVWWSIAMFFAMNASRR